MSAMRVGRMLGAGGLAVVLILTLLTGCSPAKPAAGGAAAVAPAPAPQAAFPATVKDDLGRDVTIEKAPQRLVSLAPADTEILYALGLLPKVVGVTTYDDYPAEVKSIKKMGDFTTPNLEEIAAAKPDVVFVTGGIQADVVKKLEALGARVVAVDPPSVERLYASIGIVGKATGTSAKADELVAKMKQDVTRVGDAIRDAKPVTCFVEVAQNPLYTTGSGTLLDDLISLAGGTNVVKQQGYVGYSLEQLLKDDPGVYLATKGSMNDPAQLAKRPGYDKLAAVKAKRVFILDDNLVSRPGPRIVLGLEQIAKALHPGEMSAQGSY